MHLGYGWLDVELPCRFYMLGQYDAKSGLFEQCDECHTESLAKDRTETPDRPLKIKKLKNSI